MSSSKSKKVQGGVCAPKNFVAGAIHCGIKSSHPNLAHRADLALVTSTCESIAAAVFTTNQIKAAPVKVSMEHAASPRVRAVILNSGNANACTGEQGLDDAHCMAHTTAEALQLNPKEVLVCSTGRIGVPLPIGKILQGIKKLPPTLSKTGGKAAATAIMTSDTRPKQIALELKLDGIRTRIGGMAKGAGMIRPNMATMLCVLTTDATMAPSLLRKTLREAVNQSFNRITIDGDMSTNDTVIFLANGAAGGPPLLAESPVYGEFSQALHTVCLQLARMIVLDGEGVSKFVEVEVRGARNSSDARLAAEAIANSTLLKCAWAGNDPNWGRIMDALGYCGAKVVEERVDILLNRLVMVARGVAGPAPLVQLRKAAAKKTFQITVDLNLGNSSYQMLTTDLTEEYVRLNLGE